MGRQHIETYASYTSKDAMFFSSNEVKWCNRILKWKDEHPDEVQILAYPENNDDTIYAKLPVNWFKISPKKRSYLSDEERAIRTERLRNLRLKRQQFIQNETNTEDNYETDQDD